MTISKPENKKAFTLAEGVNTQLRFPFFASGFTLAEVLFTLTVIGVVSAMTIPAVVNSTRKSEFKTSLMNAQSIINHAFTRMKTDEGTNIYLKYRSKTDQFKPAFAKYFRLYKDGAKVGIVDHASVQEDDPNFRKIYKTYNNYRSIFTNRLDDGQFIALNTYSIYIENYSGSGDIMITVDINGHKKRPNLWGHDLFTFQVMPNDSIKPMGAPGTTYTDLSQYCSENSSSNINGIACTKMALYDKEYWDRLP